MTRSTGATSTGAAAALSSCSQYNGGDYCYNGHSGLDYDTRSKTGYFVVAAAGGTVKRMGLENPSDPQFGYGYYMRLWHSGEGHSTIYAHLETDSPVRFGVATSTVVSQGQRIALSGETGEGAAHLHFGVIADDSADLTKARDPYGWTGTSGQDPWPPNSPDEENLWLNASSTPVAVDSINPSTVTNYTSVAIASTTGINFRLGWDKESSLVGNWRMDESSGTSVADVSGNGNNGTATGAAATTTAKLTNARYFDGTDDYVEIPDSASVSPTGDFSVSIWFRRGDSGREESLLSKYNSNASQTSFLLLLLDTNKLFFRVCADGSCSTQRSVETSATTTDTTAWHHVIGVFKAGASADAKIYLDGVDMSANKTGTATSVLDSSAPVTLSSVISSSGTRVDYFKGYLDEARLYTRELLPSEVMELYKVTGKGKVELTNGQSNIACTGFTLTDYRNLNNGSCPVGGAATGAWNVVVTNPDGTTGTFSNGLTINSSDPTVTAISPSSGSGSVSVTSVTGTNLRPGWDKENGLIGNWRMDESSGLTVADLSGNGYNGTASGAATTTGKLSNARDLGSTGDSVSFGDVNDLSQTSPASISFWWKGTPVSSRYVIMKEEPSDLYRGYSVFHYDFGSGVKLGWRIGQNDVSGKRTYCTTTTTVPNDGAWHHYVITQTGGTSCANNVRMFIDGVEESALTQWDSGSGAAASSTANLYAGNGSGYGVSAVGAMDELRIYNRAFSADDVVALKNVTGPGSIKLTKTSQSDITCTGFTWSTATSMTNGTCDVTGAATGAWNVQLTNPDNVSGTLTNGFTVQ
ncbi:MAG: LamG-like jellyroll fold domain-containing protein [Vicinamibacteria bacterium]